MRICIFMIALVLTGCRTPMAASSSCAFKAGLKSDFGSYWKNEPSADCSFSLNSPIKKAEDAVLFSEAFKSMFKALPTPPETGKPNLKMEVKPHED